MKKVVHLMRWFLPYTASFIRNQIVYHQEYEPAIIFLQKNESPFFEEITGNYNGYNPIQSGLDKILYEKARILSPGAKKRIREAILEIGPDVIHVHYGVDCSVYSDIIKDLGIPVCVSFYGYDCTSFPKRFLGYGRTILQNKVFNNPGVRAVLAMTEDMKRDLIELGCPEEKILVHYYGTETGPFYNDSPRQVNGTVNYLIISGLHPKKGHRFLIEAFKRLDTVTEKKVNLHIVGDGPLRSALEREVTESGLKNVKIHGPVRYGSAEHYHFLDQAHVFVHPSIMPPDGDKEGIPGAIIEAMAAGLPVISTYHAGIPYVIENERTGLLVQERDVEGLAMAMKKMAENDQLRQRIGQTGQDYARKSLDIIEKEKELEAIYDSLIS